VSLVSSDGENGAPPIILPGDAVGAEHGAASTERRLEEWLGVAAAALLHLAIILWLVLDWRLAIAPPEPEAVPVRLVLAPPEPAPPPQPAQRPTPKYRESGKDEQTTAPPAAEQAAPEPTAPPASTPSTELPAPESVDTKAEKEAPRAPRKEAALARAPHPPAPRPIEIEPGELDQRGDPYLNRLRDLIAHHWIVPKAASKLGLPLEGVAVFTLIIDPRGNLTSVTLKRSSGAPVLDAAGERMIREAAPFPPPPADFPGIDWPIVWTVELYSDAP
jgi:TonB family protein